MNREDIIKELPKMIMLLDKTLDYLVQADADTAKLGNIILKYQEENQDATGNRKQIFIIEREVKKNG